MISQEFGFKFVERGFKETLVLIPGWATDYRIFSGQDLDYNYLLPVKFHPFEFEKELSGALEKIPAGKISLFGWSLGGFLASGFALNNPGKVNELILLSVCHRFDPIALKEIKQKIAKNRKAYLYKFYLDCFSDNDTEAFTWFKKYLLKDYLKGMELENLISGLDYFLQASINAESLKKIGKVRIFHGGKDKIAPSGAAEYFRGASGEIKFTDMPETGHIPFLNRDFKKIFKNE